MKEPTLLTITRVKIADIDRSDRLRPASEAGVASIVASIRELGVMKDPVHVRKRKDGRLVLIAGLHRLLAALELGWDEIEVKVWTDVTDDWARLMEIDDNLAGAELNALDTAIFLATRKAVYERLHPETKYATGAALAKKRWDATDTMSVASFATATAQKFGMNERSVFRLIAAGSRLSAADARLLRSAPRQVTLKDLADISKVGEPVERYSIVAALAEGRAKSANDARKQYAAANGRGPVAIKDPVEEGFKALSALWSRVPEKARLRFLDDHEAAISARLHKVRDARIVNGKLGLPEGDPKGAEVIDAFAGKRGGVAG
jgi:ParB family transcriptional regulator, chromosome partitioning protein